MKNFLSDICAHPTLMPVADALTHISQLVKPITETEYVLLQDSLDRVLAEPILSNINVPSFDNSAMDGYALHTQNASMSLRVVGEALAGHPFIGEIHSGECVRITTGGKIPLGANAVIMQEQVERNSDSVLLKKLAIPGENIRRAGEDIRKGKSIFSTGRRINSIDIGLLASLGCARILVYKRLKVAVLSTGDELTPIDQPLAEGSIYDSNRYALCALLQRLAVEIIDLGLLPDDPIAIREAFTRAMQIADVVISTGGVSVGDADYTKMVLDELGHVEIWKIAMKPGKPFAFGRLGKGWFFGLPGNPVSAVVTYHQLVLPNLRRLSGEIFTPEAPLNGIASSTLKKQAGRADYQRGVFVQENDGVLLASTTGSQSSGMLSSMAEANCFIVLERERGNVEAGETIAILPFDQFLR